MNTPPRSPFPAFRFPVSSFTRAPRRSYAEQSISPPRLRPFEDLDGLELLSAGVEQERIRKIEREKEVKRDITQCISKMSEDEWMARGTVGFSGVYTSL